MRNTHFVPNRLDAPTRVAGGALCTLRSCVLVLAATLLIDFDAAAQARNDGIRPEAKHWVPGEMTVDDMLFMNSRPPPRLPPLPTALGEVRPADPRVAEEARSPEHPVPREGDNCSELTANCDK